jgi:peptidyl-lysine (3S)-dioxygenase / protease
MEEQLSALVGDYWTAGALAYLDAPSALELLREMQQYRPFVIRGAMDDWPARTLWNLQYLANALPSDFNIGVAVTPDGRADAVTVADGIDLFQLPAEVNMTFSTFKSMLEEPQAGDAVAYLSLQNDNFRKGFPSAVQQDTRPIATYEEAIGRERATLEAVNLWIGDERSVSSIHKDHFDNLYCVVSGAKTFTLLPPTDVAFLPERLYPAFRHHLRPSSDGRKHTASDRIRRDDLVLERDESIGEVSWVSLDPDDPHVLDVYPDFCHAHPLRVTVYPGEILFIPSLWYHRVSQDCLTIAINYWYDMIFDHRYVLYRTIKEWKERRADGNLVAP